MVRERAHSLPGEIPGEEVCDDEPKRWVSSIPHAPGEQGCVEALPQHRRDSLALRPEFLGEIRRLHAEFVAKTCLNKLGATPDAAVDEAFAGGSWLVTGALPPDGLLFSATEEAFGVRGWALTPAPPEAGAAEGLLQSWGVAAINSKGSKGCPDSGALGQDNCCVAHLDGGWELFGVFDGHGPCGHWPSSRAARMLPFFLQQGAGAAMLKAGQVEAALRFAFDAVEHDLEAGSVEEYVDLQVSGSTAVVALRHAHQDCIWLATVGDSRAALLAPGRGALEATSDHKPSRSDEAERIVGMGGVVKTTNYADGYCDERVYVKGTSFPALGITRSFGDCAVKAIGVTSEPEVLQWPLDGSKGAYLLACSDGVWEFLETEAAASCVLGVLEAGGTPQGALEKLLAASREEWRKSSDADEIYCDDITLVLAPLTGARAPLWRPGAEGGPSEPAGDAGDPGWCTTS